MIISAPFIVRPVATTLLTLAVVLAGLLSFFLLPVAPLPQVDIPTISVSASLPGASPETMASSVATPLERSLGSIAGVTSSSSQGSTRVTLQFDLSRDINGAARDAGRHQRGALAAADQPAQQSHVSQVNPSDAPIMTLALTSDTLSQGQLYDLASTIVAQKLSQVDGVGEVTVGGSSLPAVRDRAARRAGQPRRVAGRRAHGAGQCQRQPPQGRAGERPLSLAGHGQRPAQPRRAIQAADRGLARRRAGARVGRGQGRGFG